MADIDNCFRRILISESLGQYFTFLGCLSARELGLTCVVFCGILPTADSCIRIRCASLPMGFGWSLCFAQRINKQRVSEAKSLSKHTLVDDMAKVVVTEPHSPTLHHFVYVDNPGVIALKKIGWPM